MGFTGVSMKGKRKTTPHRFTAGSAYAAHDIFAYIFHTQHMAIIQIAAAKCWVLLLLISKCSSNIDCCADQFYGSFWVFSCLNFPYSTSCRLQVWRVDSFVLEHFASSEYVPIF